MNRVKEIWDVAKKYFDYIQSDPLADRNDLADLIEKYYQKGYDDGYYIGYAKGKSDNKVLKYGNM